MAFTSFEVDTVSLGAAVVRYGVYVPCCPVIFARWKRMLVCVQSLAIPSQPLRSRRCRKNLPLSDVPNHG